MLCTSEEKGIYVERIVIEIMTFCMGFVTHARHGIRKVIRYVGVEPLNIDSPSRDFTNVQ